MKTNKFIISTLIISLSLINISCEESGDTTLPNINLIAPAEGASLEIGKDIHFEAEFSDNEMLGSYKIEIHNNIERPHDHSSKAAEEETYFSFSDTWDLSGKRNTTVHHHEIVIPANSIPGNYHLVVYCIDAAGNESYAARNIVLTHDEVEEDHK